MTTNEGVRITAVWSRRIGDIVQTLVEIDREWRLVCEEHYDGPFSHIAEANNTKRWPLDPIRGAQEGANLTDVEKHIVADLRGAGFDNVADWIERLETQLTEKTREVEEERQKRIEFTISTGKGLEILKAEAEKELAEKNAALQQLTEAAKRQPLKTEELKRQIIYNRDASCSCETHGQSTIVGVTPHKHCQVCDLEAALQQREEEIRRLTSEHTHSHLCATCKQLSIDRTYHAKMQDEAEEKVERLETELRAAEEQLKAKDALTDEQIDAIVAVLDTYAREVDGLDLEAAAIRDRKLVREALKGATS